MGYIDIDTEHGQIGPETVTNMLRALDLSNTPALVRLGDAGAGRVKHALDAGAAGVLIPYIETVEEARAAVRVFCAPPLGKRGMATGVSRAGSFGANKDYARTWNDTGILALQIETGKGLAVAADIAALEGVDMLFFGPSDYSADQNLDVALFHSKVQRGLTVVVTLVHRHTFVRQERAHDRGVPLPRGDSQRGPSALVGPVHVRASA